MKSKPSHSRIVRIDGKDLPKATPAQLARLRSLMDGPVDTSDIPEMKGTFARVFRGPDGRLPRPPKSALTLRLDDDLVNWFKSQGSGYQSHMRQVLRNYYLAHARPGRANRLPDVLARLRELAEQAQELAAAGRRKAAG